MTSCGMNGSLTFSCWGYNAQGQLGDGTTVSRMRPNRVNLLMSKSYRLLDISLGAHHACALDDLGEVFCWGSNQYGQVGVISEGNRVTTPQPVEGVVEAARLATGFNHTCVMLDDDTIWCWGQNHQGQLGDGTTTDRVKPAQVVF